MNVAPEQRASDFQKKLHNTKCEKDQATTYNNASYIFVTDREA